MSSDEKLRRRIPDIKEPSAGSFDADEDLSNGHYERAATDKGMFIESRIAPLTKSKVNYDEIDPPTNIDIKLLIPAILTAFALFTRMYQIGKSNKVVWDEAHFGKFGNHYIRREFYHDVHPPLGKMLVGLSGYLIGNNATFSFESGKEYPQDVNYIFQRMFLSVFGTSLVPLSYFTALNLGMSWKAAFLASSMVLLDNALCVISRFILLDSMLLSFTAFSFFFLTGFHRQREQPFSLNWWVYLAGTGVSIGLASSVKWVGLFSVALVGLYTLEDLYHKWGDYEMPKDEYLTHWLARITLLILVPVTIYVACFYVHFSVLNHSGPGDSTMSSLFQARLVGTSIGRGPVDVAFGSKVTIKSYTFGGGLLHSHPSLYPEGSRQHQITIYHHSDTNNDWVILRDHETTSKRRKVDNQTYPGEFATPSNDYMDIDEDPELPAQLLAHGDIIRLSHVGTGANLHSHPVNAPISNKDLEASGYLNRTLGDDYDHWVLEIYDDLIGDPQGKVRTLSTRFRLRHHSLGCYLMPSGARLPEWGFGQGEVVCRPEKLIAEGDALWNIENHNNARLPMAQDTSPRQSPFFRDFLHLNVAMWNSNSALTTDPDHNDSLASQPYHWPLMLKGIRMCGWDDAAVKFYMLGNPLVWWLSTWCLLAIVACGTFYLLRFKRRFREWYKDEWNTFQYSCRFILVGYVLQYLPYFIMGRVMYVHHYFPALYFSIFAPAFILDHLTRRSGVQVQWILFVTTTVSVLLTFVYFSPITYGMDFPASELHSRNWLSTWQISKL
ncbi:Protein O-mannosyltransferase 2 [Entomophthora muscae]|uniref:Protein O-mannosyltransferase 2 n=1 Tax=Entomophthora muscae TaxID=34485 RepID=A0ACC2THW9_9FUNG|nr:Protein O-mannosyltransferase 2 [Entomophthora muscae]